ncbi:MAG: RNA pseudouridine synthase [Sutterella sp. 54_7]|nr:MAG: RNA pseudouridine synthase [Sutterella sp. 54_7]
MSISLIGEITPTPSAELKTVPADRVSYVLIGEDADGQRLDNFLFRIAKGVPKGHVYRVIRAGEVRVSKKRAKAETKLMLGDVVRIPPMRVAQKPAGTPPAAPLAQGVLPVLYEDERNSYLEAVAGKYGIAVEVLRKQVGQMALSGAGRTESVKPRNTASNKKEKEGGVEKHYKLLVKGDWVNERQHVKVPLERYLLPSGERRVRASSEGMSAHTIFTVLERFGSVTYLDAELKTGRTHQIRVHMQAIGHPLLGDSIYNTSTMNREQCTIYRAALHAWKVRLRQPFNGRKIELEVPVPEDFKKYGGFYVSSSS